MTGPDDSRSPKRIQMSRQRPWRAEHPDAVIVDRRTKWGNPLRWDSKWQIDAATGVRSPLTDRERRGIVTSGFRQMVSDPDSLAINGYPSPAEVRRELRGRDLACWCPLDQPCHADVLLELAND